MRRSTITSVALVPAMILVCTGCLEATPASPGPAAHSATSPAPAKATCPEAVLDPPPAGMEMSHQELVPFSSTLFGVKTTFRDPTGPRMIELVSGGYVDEFTESYDDLVVEGTRPVAGAEATILVGTLLTVTVRVVLWQSPDTVEPCDVHALLASGLPRDQFDDALTDITISNMMQYPPTEQRVTPK